MVASHRLENSLLESARGRKVMVKRTSRAQCQGMSRFDV